jgi:hypothetical protein
VRAVCSIIDSWPVDSGDVGDDVIGIGMGADGGGGDATIGEFLRRVVVSWR